MLSKIIFLIGISLLGSTALANADWYLSTKCAPDVQAQVEDWCSGKSKGYCSPLFNDAGYPIKPGYVDRIKAAVPLILEAAERFEIPVEHLIGALLTVQVKGGYKTVNSKLSPTPGSGQAFLNPNPISGIAEIVPTPGSGDSIVPDQKSGDTRIIPEPKSGDAALTPDPKSGDVTLIPSPASGDQDTGFMNDLPCNDSHGYNNLARLDHDAPRDAESFLAQFEKRDELSCRELHNAINLNGQDIMYMAALMKRNRVLFAEAEELYQYQVNYGLAAAVTIYGLADVDEVADRVVSAKRNPRPNTWGLYALCQQPLIEEIKALIPSKQP